MGLLFFFLFLKKEKKKQEGSNMTFLLADPVPPCYAWGFFVVVVFVTLGMLQIYLLISVNKQFQTFRLAHFCVFI